ncbi:hypothetical protein OIU76_015597, partial [Salix suchowensis]
MGDSLFSMASAIPSSMAHFTTAILVKPNTYFHISTSACASSSSSLISSSFFVTDPISLSLSLSLLLWSTFFLDYG